MYSEKRSRKTSKILRILYDYTIQEKKRNEMIFKEEEEEVSTDKNANRKRNSKQEYCACFNMSHLHRRQN